MIWFTGTSTPTHSAYVKHHVVEILQLGHSIKISDDH